MQVCILSMQDVQNFGSLLQAFALKKNLEKLGHSVDFISIESNEDDNKLMNGFTESYIYETRNSGLLSKLRRIDKYAINRLKIRYKASKQDKFFNEFRTLNLYYNHIMREELFDYCVIGSDEVFNCCAESAWGFTSQLFGNVQKSKKVITYAASCGSTSIDKIPSMARDKIKSALANVSAISVRDANSFKFVRDIANREALIHMDPVLLYDFEEELKHVSIDNMFGAPFCLIYSYYNRINDKNDIQSIQMFCKKHNLKIVSVGAPQAWINNYYVVDPFQMLVLFKNASYVITDTFHGTIFASKYTCRFATFVKESNSYKLQYLINTLKIGNHQIKKITIDELERAYNKIHDKVKFQYIIENERKKSLNYLSQSIH